MTDDERPPPHLRVAAENDVAKIRAKQAMEAVEASLRKLAANLMRVTRGAGKSYEIGRDCSDVIQAFHAYRDAAGHWPPSWDLDKALGVEDPLLKRYGSNEWPFYDARDQVVRAGLRLAAARLLDQRLQISAGEHDLAAAVRQLQEAREERAAKLKKITYSDLKARRGKAGKNSWDD